MTQNTFKFRFGTLKAADVKTAASGKEYLRYAIDAGQFTAYGVAFEPALIKALAETEIGTKVRVGGFLDVKTVATDGGEKTYLTLITRNVKVDDGELISAKQPTDAADEALVEEAQVDDLTQIKGIGAKSAAKLNALGYMTFAQLAAATAAEQNVLDEDVPAVKGTFSRSDVFGQAAKLAA